jgi:hypothetical protein
MPDTNHPPYGLGAQQPRTLIRWLDVNSQNGPLKRARYTLTIPAFTLNVSAFPAPPLHPYINGDWITAAWNYTSPNRFTILDLSHFTSNNE